MKTITLITLIFAFLLNTFTSIVAQETVNMTEETTNALSQAEVIVEEMRKGGFGIIFFDDMLLDAKEAFARKDYELVLDKVEQINQRRERAFKINDSIAVLETRAMELEELGLKTSDVLELLEFAKSSFKKEAFDDAERLIFRTSKEFDEIEAEYSRIGVLIASAKDNVISYVKENWLLLLIITAVSTVFALLIYRRVELMFTKQKLEDTKLKKDILADLMKKTEELYFNKKTVGKEEYELTMRKYQDELTEIKGTIPVLEGRLKNLTSFFNITFVKPLKFKNKFKKSKSEKKHAKDV